MPKKFSTQFMARAAAVLSVLSGTAMHMQSAEAQVSVRTAKGVAKAKAGEILVKFAPSPVAREISQLRGVRSSIRSRAASIHTRAGGRELETFDFIGWQLVQLPKGMSVEEGIELYKRQPGVLAAEPNVQRIHEIVPNDPKFTEQYALERIKAAQAWDRNRGNANVVVAVIDEGVDYRHPDLAANMWKNPGEVGNGKETNKIDDDKNGYVDDVYGIDGADGDTDPIYKVNIAPDGSKSGDHGTHVAGIIGAVGNNAQGISGVNWTVKIMALRGLSANPSFADGTLRCLRYATAMKLRGINIRVTNNSYGGYGPGSQAEIDAFNAAGAAGILNVASAGNAGQDNEKIFHFVSDYNCESIVGVGSSDQNDYRSSFSNWGKSVIDLAAPGSDIWSTVPPEFDASGYKTMSGTSMASPCVAGAAALLAAINPALTVPQLKATLMNTVDPVSAWEGLTVTGGRLNLARAAASVHSGALPMVTSASPTGLVNVLKPSIKLTFNKPMDVASVQAAFEITPKVAGTFTWANSNTQLTFTPTANLLAGASYLVNLKGTAMSSTGVKIDSNLNRVSQGSPADDHTFNFRIAGTPFNDMFAKAYLLTGESGKVPGHNRGATQETGEPEHNTYGGAGDKSVWYKWVSPVRGNITFNTNGSGFYNVIGIYTGSSVGALSRVAGDYWPDNNAVSVTFRAAKSQVFYIAIDGFYFPKSDNNPVAFTDTGNFMLNWFSHASPVNDFYATATAISGVSGNVTGNTLGAYSEPGEPYYIGADSSLWYKWIAPGTGAAIFHTEGSGFDTTLNAFTGSTISTATKVAQDNDGGTGSLSQLRFTCIAGTAYFISVGGNGYAFNDPRGDFKLTWGYTAGPANDNFVAATNLTPAGGTITGNTNGATLQPSENDPTWGYAVGSIWYKWKPTVNGALTLSTAGSSYNTDLAVYTGTAVNALTQVDHNNDDESVANLTTSRLKFTAQANVTYYIRIDNGGSFSSESSEGYPQSHGPVKLTWTFAPAPANDKFISPALLSTASGTTTGSTVGATLDPSEEDPTWGNGGYSIWYKYVPAANGALTLSTAGSKALTGQEYNTYLSVYTGTDLSALETVASNNDDESSDPLTFSRVRLDVVKGVTYLIRIDNAGYVYGGSAEKFDGTHGTVNLKWDFLAGPANDNFASAVNLGTATSGKVVGTTVGATMQPGEEDPTWGSGPMSIWYKWTATRSGNATFTTAGSKNLNGLVYDTYLAVYSGTFPTLDWVATNNDDGSLATSKVTFFAEPGVTYYIRVSNGGYAGYDSYKAYQESHGPISLGWTWVYAASPWLQKGLTAEAPQVSDLKLSIGSANAATAEVRLAFYGALDAESALDPARYNVTLHGEVLEVESVRLENGGRAAILKLADGVVQSGDQLQVAYELLDSNGAILKAEPNTINVK